MDTYFFPVSTANGTVANHLGPHDGTGFDVDPMDGDVIMGDLMDGDVIMEDLDEPDQEEVNRGFLRWRFL